MQTQQAQAVSTRRTEIGSRKSVAAVEPLSPNLGAESIGVALVGGDMLFREGLKSLFGRSDLAVLGEFDRASDLESSSDAAYKPTIVVVVSPTHAVGGKITHAFGLTPKSSCWRPATMKRDWWIHCGWG